MDQMLYSILGRAYQVWLLAIREKIDKIPSRK